MLHAITHNKTKLHYRYLGHRKDNENRVMEEDELTSLIMSPLSFLQDDQIKKFWKSLVEWNTSESLSLQLPEDSVESAIMYFWPCRKSKNSDKPIVPDMLVEFKWISGERRILLVEFKWKSSLSERQLQKQWIEFLTEKEQELAYHIFIGRDIGEGYKTLKYEDVWNGKLLMRSWLEILTMLNHLDYKDEHISFLEWSLQTRKLLHKLNIVSFNGFNSISTSAVKNYDVNVLNLFQYKKNDFLIYSIDTPLFFSDKEEKGAL